jgi:hypothetical protein
MKPSVHAPSRLFNCNSNPRPRASSAPVVWLLGLALGLAPYPWTFARSADGAPAAAPPADKAIEFKVKFPVGQRQVQRQIVKQDQKISMPGSDEPMKQEIQQVQDLAVTVAKAREGGGHELELEFVAQQLDFRMGSTIMKFDSKSDPKQDGANPIAAVFRKLVGARIKLLMDAKGRLEKVEGVRELTEKLSEGGGGTAQALAQGLLQEENLKHLGVLAEGLPDKPVKVGERWPVKIDLNVPPLGAISVSMLMTFRGWETRADRLCAILDHVGSIAGKASAGAGAPATPRINGDTSGRMWYDPEAGLVVESTAEQKMAIKMEVQTQAISVLMQQSVTNTLVEFTPAAKP